MYYYANIRETESTVYNCVLYYSRNPSNICFFPYHSSASSVPVLARILHWLRIHFLLKETSLDFALMTWQFPWDQKDEAQVWVIWYPIHICVFGAKHVPNRVLRQQQSVSEKEWHVCWKLWRTDWEMHSKLLSLSWSLSDQTLFSCAAMCCAPSWCPSEAATRCFVYP